MKTTNIMPKQENKHISMHFRQIGGIWLRVDSQSQIPPLLSEVCDNLEIEFPNDCYFARFKKLYMHETHDIVIRQYGGSITINICIMYE